MAEFQTNMGKIHPGDNKRLMLRIRYNLRQFFKKWFGFFEVGTTCVLS